MDNYFYSEDYIFSYEKNGLNLAVAFTAYDTETEPILDDSYGRLIFNAVEWGPNPDGTYYSRRTELETHTCSREELGITDDKS